MTPVQRKNTGGVGEFYPPSGFPCFGLKVVPLLDKDRGRNRNFWNEAKSIHRYCGRVRFLSGSLKIPMAVHYYLHQDDSLGAGWRENKRTPKIAELFRGVCIERGQLIRYRKYRAIPEELLRRIYDEDLDADLLLVYPMAYGGEKNLSSYYGDDAFFAEDARALIGQVAAAILDLYRCGTAHGDIKPENIMVSEIGGKKLFRLTDFGSAHFEDAPSDSGTKVFYDRVLYETILNKTGSELIARIYTDFYALNRTVLVLALGYLPDNVDAEGKFILVNDDCVTERWPEIREEWEMLQQLDRRTMDDFRKLAAEEPAAVNPDWEPFYSPRIEFDSMIIVNGTMEYGWLHEQISFSNRFDPLMRVSGIETDRAVLKLFPEFCHVPLAVSPYEKIFHAPDDARTGQPPLNFHDYTPATLDNIQLTDEEKERLTGYGKKLNEYFVENPGARACLPMKEDIFRCGGALKMIWGKQTTLVRAIDYEAYFRLLAANQADLSPCHWLQICSCTSRFDDRIDAAMAWKIFKEARRKTAMDLLKKHPHIADLLHSMPSPETDEGSYFNDFLNLCKWDRETFLLYFPAARRADLTEKQWEKCLQVNPGLLEFVPEETLLRLRRKTWVRILGTEPGLIGKCPCADRFSAEEWGSILLQQPQLKKYCPAGIVFPDRMKRRLEKKDFFRKTGKLRGPEP